MLATTRSARRFKWILALAPILVLCAGGLATADVGDDDDGLTRSHEQQLRDDAHALSASGDLSEVDVLHRIEQQEELSLVIMGIRESIGEDLSGLFVDIGSGQVTLRLVQTGAIGEVDTKDVLLGFPLPDAYYLVVETGGAHSERAFHDEVTRISSALAESGIVNHGVEYDPRLEKIVVLAGAETDVAVIAELSKFLLRVVVEGGESGPTLSGGVGLSTCTAGFAVRIPNGSRGLLTAGHCGNSQKYALTPSGSAAYTSTFVAALSSPNADLQWHRMTAHTPEAKFYGSSASVATVRVGTGVAYVGEGLCHRGKTTGYSCGYVTSVSYAPPASWNVCGGSACSANWVRVSGVDLANIGGDSGGPWFSGGYAYGIHSGGLIAEVGAWAVYTPIARISGLGVVLI